MKNELLNIVSDYFKNKPIQRAWIFGSYSRGEETPESDVDILISFMPGTKMGLQYFGMIIDLENMLKRPVDLVVEGDLLPFAEIHANKDKILFYERADKR